MDVPKTSIAYKNPTTAFSGHIYGWTDQLHPYTNYTVNGTVDQMAMDTQIWELGNSLHAIKFGPPAPGSIEDPSVDPGARELMDCYLKAVGRPLDDY